MELLTLPLPSAPAAIDDGAAVAVGLAWSCADFGIAAAIGTVAAVGGVAVAVEDVCCQSVILTSLLLSAPVAVRDFAVLMLLLAPLMLPALMLLLTWLLSEFCSR